MGSHNAVGQVAKAVYFMRESLGMTTSCKVAADKVIIRAEAPFPLRPGARLTADKVWDESAPS